MMVFLSGGLNTGAPRGLYFLHNNVKSGRGACIRFARDFVAVAKKFARLALMRIKNSAREMKCLKFGDQEDISRAHSNSGSVQLRALDQLLSLVIY